MCVFFFNYLCFFFCNSVASENEIVANAISVRWSAVPVPCLSKLFLKLRGEQGSGPEGVDDLCFHTYGEFSPSPPGIGPLGWDLDLKAEIWASRLGSGPPG